MNLSSKNKAQSLPTLQLHTLPQADGSATYTFNNHTITCAVNGPIEPQRRDEHPTEAFVEVNVRPASGPGGPPHRHLSHLLHRTLTHHIRVRAHPRSLIQITFQILRSPAESASAGAVRSLPHLVNCGVAALLDAGVEMWGACTAVLVGLVGGDDGDGDGVVGGRRRAVVWPDEEEEGNAGALFAVGFGVVPKGGAEDGGEGLVLVETEGAFDIEEYEEVMKVAEGACRGKDGLEQWLREAVGGRAVERNRWRNG